MGSTPSLCRNRLPRAHHIFQPRHCPAMNTTIKGRQGFRDIRRMDGHSLRNILCKKKSTSEGMSSLRCAKRKINGDDIEPIMRSSRNLPSSPVAEDPRWWPQDVRTSTLDFLHPPRWQMNFLSWRTRQNLRPGCPWSWNRSHPEQCAPDRHFE